MAGSVSGRVRSGSIHRAAPTTSPSASTIRVVEVETIQSLGRELERDPAQAPILGPASAREEPDEERVCGQGVCQHGPNRGLRWPSAPNVHGLTLPRCAALL